MVAFLDLCILARIFWDRGGRGTDTAVKLETENSGAEKESY